MNKTKRKKNASDGNKVKTLTEWDWETLVASWRYYEYRSTISSSMFPAEIVRRFFSGEYDEKSMMDIARQFADVDHGIRGEDDWTVEWKNLPDCDKKPWCKFYAFCRAYYCGEFHRVTLDNGKKHEVIEAFHCKCTGRWYPREGYIKNPNIEQYCDPTSIKAIDGIAVEKESK